MAEQTVDRRTRRTRKLQDLVQRNGSLLLQRQYDVRDGADTPYLLAFLSCGLVEGAVRTLLA